MPLKFVCNLRFHEVLQTTIIRQITNFMKPKVADKLPWHYMYKIKYIFIYYNIYI